MATNKYGHLTVEEKIAKIADAITWYVELNGNKDKLLQKIAEIVDIELPKEEPTTGHWRPPYGGGITYRGIDSTNLAATTTAIGVTDANAVVNGLWPTELAGQPTKKYRQVVQGKVLRVGDEIEEHVETIRNSGTINAKV